MDLQTRVEVQKVIRGESLAENISTGVLDFV